MRITTNLRSEDNIHRLAEKEQALVELVDLLDKTSTPYRMEINAEKTKI